MDINYVIIIFITLIFSAIFSGIEMAFISADKLHIELKNKQGIRSANIIASFFNNSSNFLATLLVGNTIALVVYGIFMAKSLEPIIASWLPAEVNGEFVVPIFQTIIATIIVLVTAEFLPKRLFMLNPNRMLKFFAPLMQLIFWVLTPVVWLMVVISKFIIEKILKLKYSEAKQVFGLVDLGNYVKNVLKVSSNEEQVEVSAKMFTNALEFKTVKVRDCMIPRTEISAVDIKEGISDLEKEFIESGHSKVLVYDESIDNVIGYCHSLKLFTKPGSIEKILTKIPIVSETMLANELMIQLITDHKSLALVVDEFGGTSGVVSIEDIIEEIFGEIRDEYDDEDLMEKKIDDKTYHLSARLEIDYLNEKYKWEIPKDDYETLSGYILSKTENIPEVNEVIETENFTFTVLSKEETRMELVKVYWKYSAIE